VSESWVDQLRRERVSRRLSQRVLAEQVGVSQPTLSAWETGRIRPLREHAEQWARGLDIALPVGVAASLVPVAAACGTDSGYNRHRRLGTVACDPCIKAHADYQVGYLHRRRLGVSGDR
jgi:transcriptional regulator with XRE-family HTH domain